MTLQSMTGFSRSQATHDLGSWVWELRSVNNKGLDVRLRLPPGFESIEMDCKKRISSSFSRGSLQANLQYAHEAATYVPKINEEALETIITAIEPIRKRINAPGINIESLLSIKGVVEMQEKQTDESSLKDRNKLVLESLDIALAELESARKSEGSAIVAVLLEQVSQIEALVTRVKNDSSRSMQAIRDRLQQQLEPLLKDASFLDPQRLHQEAAILATKADLQEELDRLDAHVIAAKELLTGKGPAGRKLDFLAQEFNRECNTLCSKSNAPSVTKCGLELKILVDQLREQTQNLE